MFDAIFNLLAWLLDFFYTYFGRSYGLAIALLTFTVMLACFPLTAKATRGMAAMSKLQPELKKIQAKYKDDRQKQSEATMALFKEHNVTPLGGCLPMLVQAPVFIIMYRVLIGLTHRGDDGTFDPKYLSRDSHLFRALDGAREMKSFGINLAETASEAAKESFGTALPYFVVIAIVVATGYYQQRQITRRNPQGQNAADNPYMQSMQRMTKIFPLMYLVFGFTLPAGILIYFMVSNLFRIGQQALIYKMDPTLLPGSGAPLATSAKIVDAKTVEKKRDAGSAPDAGGNRPKGEAKGEPKARRGEAATEGKPAKPDGRKPDGSKGGGGASAKGGGAASAKGGRPPGARGGGGKAGNGTPRGGPRPSGRVTPKKTRRGR